MSLERSVTFRTAPNIALVKYWGKRDKQQNLPLNSSISLTLDNNEIYTQTTVSLSESFTSDCIVFNGEKRTIDSDKKILKVLTVFRSWVKEATHSLIEGLSNEQLASCPIRIETFNSFPTAAGMASSASGIACLTKALSNLYQINHLPEDAIQLNNITRMASGSACRSLYGGLVKWDRGDDHTPSIAHQIYDASFWSEIRIAVCVVSNQVKSVSSTEGMNRCVETSDLMKQRTAEFVEERINEVIDAYSHHDFQVLAELIMKDSDSLHDICHSANPPINYLSSDSYRIIELVKSINHFYKRNLIAYSFDAGSNAFLFYEKKDEQILFPIISKTLQPKIASCDLLSYSQSNTEGFFNQYLQQPISIEKFYSTTIGNGPYQLLCVCSNRIKLKPFKNRWTIFLHKSITLIITIINTKTPTKYFIFNNCATAGKIICCSEEEL